MKKFLILIVLLSSFTALLGQTKEELEKELSYFIGDEKYSDKIDKAQLLIEIDPFNYNAVYFICRYYTERKIDSISVFFDNLINKYPDRIEPLLLRSDFLYFEHDFKDKPEYIKWKIKYLNLALQIDNSNKKTLYDLSETYYKDFIWPLEKVDYGIFFDPGDKEIDSTFIKKLEAEKKSAYEHSADSALKYFYILWQVDNETREVVFFPIRQLECFLGKNKISPITENITTFNDYCYFPPWYFANLKENWECDYSVDYLFKVELSKMNSKGIERQLKDLEEPCLYNSKFSEKKEVYRFTWLRSFHNPISIRVEKSNEKAYLYWKVGKGAGGYEPEGLKRNGKKKLKEHDWAEFIKLVNKIKFESLPNQKYISMCDGASWTLENKTNTKFKAHDTNEPSDYFKECCLYLLKLSGIKVKKDDIY
ncbi:MAG: hypothetical protein U0W24_08490 [Bacteroidales bacterium]